MAVDNRRARVTGAQFEPSPNQKIKLEGARLVGERAILLCANADPRFINKREFIAQELDQLVQSLVCEDSPRDYQLLFRFYGINGVMPASIINPALPSETGIVVECVAPTAERALSVLRTTKQYLLHFGYEGRLSTAGNLAFPFTPPEIVVGPAYEFSIYHLMEIEDQAEHFKISIEQM